MSQAPSLNNTVKTSSHIAVTTINDILSKTQAKIKQNKIIANSMNPYSSSKVNSIIN